MITTRDMAVVEFVRTYKIASTQTIKTLFFAKQSDYACQKRLKVIADTGLLKRIRDNVNRQYIYYDKLPGHVAHSLLVTDFYAAISKKCGVTRYEVEPVYGDIRPDASFEYVKLGRKYVGLLEVELSHKPFNYQKYYRFYESGEYQNYFTAMPRVFVVCDHFKLPEIGPVWFVAVGTDLLNIPV